MPTSQITNTGGIWGETATVHSPEFTNALNNSGGTLLPGDVVVVSTDTTGSKITTTTTASDPTVIGVVAARVPSDSINTQSTDTYAAGAVVPVIVRGPARINIAANTVAAGAALSTSTAAKVAAVAGTAGSVGALQALAGTFIAVTYESQAAKDSNNTVRAYIAKF